MTARRELVIWWLAVALSALPGPGAASDLPIVVAVSVPPQADLVRQVGGELVEVVIAVPAGSSPHVFDPTPRQVAQLAKAQLYVATGVEVEATLLPRLRAVAPDLTVVGSPAAEGLPGHHDHDHHRGDRLSSDLDPHRWLDPRLAAEQVRAIEAALVTRLPHEAAALSARADTTVGALMQLHQELAVILAPVRGRDLVVVHPAFGHLAAAYGLHQIAIEDDGHQPTPRHLAAVLARVQERGASTLFVQPQFPAAAARRLAAAAKVELVILDPLAPDLIPNLRTMARAIAIALDPDAGS